jgi:hypothetical protein
MSTHPHIDSTDDVSDLSDEELLERLAGLDPDACPIAPVAEQALALQEDGDS